MTDDPSSRSDLKAAWTSQPEEPTLVNLEDIRRKAARFQRRKRIGNAVEYLACLVVIPVFGLYIFIFPGLMIKLGSAYGIVWALFYMWQRHRLMSARPLPEDAAACLDFHRSELQRQHDVVRFSWRWVLAPLIPVCVLFGLGRWFEAPAEWRTPWVDRGIILMGMAVLIESLVMMGLWFLNRADRLQDLIDELDGQRRTAP